MQTATAAASATNIYFFIFRNLVRTYDEAEIEKYTRYPRVCVCGAVVNTEKPPPNGRQ